MEIPEKQKRLAKFWKKFLRLTRGRVTVLRALALAEEEEKDPAFKKAVHALRQTVEAGSPLSDALKKHPAEFSPSIIELIKTAEKSGAWDDILPEIVEGLEEGTFD